MGKISNIDLYRKLCQKKDVSIFSQAWWLDAVYGKEAWDVIIIEDGKKVLAGFAYGYQKMGKVFRGIFNPPLSNRVEIYIDQANGIGNFTAISRQNKYLGKIIEELPNHDHFEFSFHYRFNNWLPFYWRNYRQLTKYSYIIDTFQDLSKIYEGFSPRVKNILDKTNFCLVEDDDISKFYSLVVSSYKGKNMKFPYPFQLVKRIDEACKDKGAGKALFASDEYGEVIAGAYFVWDKQSLYLLMSGVNEHHKNSGAASFLIWEGIKLAHSMKKSFDFEGSSMKSIETFFRNFGGELRPYYTIYKTPNLLLSFLLKLKKRHL